MGFARRCGVIFVVSMQLGLKSGNVLAEAGCTIELVPPYHYTSGSAVEWESSFAVESSDCTCEWTAESDSDRIVILSPASGVGPGTVRFRVVPSDGKAPTAKAIRVGSVTFEFRNIGPFPEPVLGTAPAQIVVPRIQGGGYVQFGGLFPQVTIGEISVPWFRFGRLSGHPAAPFPYGVDENPGEARSGFAMVQRAATYRMMVLQQGPATGESALCLGPDGALRIAENKGGVFNHASNRIDTGYRHDPLRGSQVFAADIDGNGLADIATLTEYGDLWRMLRNPAPTAPIFWANEMIASPHLAIDATSRVFVADANGDGFDDLAHSTPQQIGVLYNRQGDFPGPLVKRGPGLRWEPASGREILVGDFDGAAGEELLAFAPDGAATLVPLDGSDRRAFGNIGKSSVDPDGSCDGIQLLAGDFDGDGLCDVVAIDASEILLARSDGTRLLMPYPLPTQGFHYSPNRGDEGWHVFAADISGDGRADLVQLNRWGELWTARSLGNSFEAPFLNGITGFRHDREGPWQVFFGRTTY